MEHWAKKKKLEAMPGHLADLADKVYPGKRELVDEDPDDLETRFRDKAMGVEAGETPDQPTKPESEDTIEKVSNPEADIIDEGKDD